MRWMGMLSALLVLVAVFFGVSSLTAFGYGAREIVWILVPTALGVAVFFAGVTHVGVLSARWLNRGRPAGSAGVAKPEERSPTGDDAASGKRQASPGD